MRKILSLLLAFSTLVFFTSTLKAAGPTTITNITISPDFDISYFDNYTFSADISPEPASATLSLEGINGDGGSDWNYYADGTGTGQSLSYEMVLDSGTTWKKTAIRPDHIYPTILFVPASISWGYSPIDINIWRNSYHLFHFTNPFSLVDDMNFWIEINATPNSTVNSADLEVYLVKKDKTVSFFQSDWRNSSDLELVGAISKKASFHHEHSANSSHYLIRLSANNDGTFGSNNVDISGDFWLILYNKSPNVNRGWELKYHQDSICSNSNGWYLGGQLGWTANNQAGCPDVHVHFARRSTYADGVKATVTADSTSSSENFSFAVLPNLAPNPTNFSVPVRGVYSGSVNVTWNAATDPNEDPITYNLYLLDSDNNVDQTLITDTALTSFTWDTTDGETDGNYSLKGQACDDSSLCTDFYSEPFSLNNADSIQSLDSITMSSNNSDSAKAVPGNTVTLAFTADGTITTPTVAFFSGGYAVNNTITVTNTSDNNWTAAYVVNANDTNGKVTFTINASNLDLEYTEVTSGSYITIDTSSASSSNSASSTSSDTCGSQPPNLIPELFQIDINNTTATLYYTPFNSQELLTDYYIAYSETTNQFQHGTFTNQGPSSGVLSYTIRHLKPNTTYYFRVRGQNGCMPGSFSGEMEATTRKWFQLFKVSYYKHGQTAQKTLKYEPAPTVSVAKQDSEENSHPTPTPIKAPEAKEEKKWCFLWWCF